MRATNSDFPSVYSGRAPERIYYGRSCSTTYYTVNEDLVVRYKFYDGEHPVETWHSFDASVRAFVRSLVVAGEQ